MKRKLLSAAISAVALAGVSQSSQATSFDLYIAGSSAQDNIVIAQIYGLCANGGADFKYYIDNGYAANGATNTGSWGSNYKAYTCTVDSTKVTGLSAGDVVTFHKVNFGGSAQGVAPLFQGVAVPTLNINNSNCYQVGTYSAKLPNGTAVPTYGCTTTNTNDLVAQNLDAGVSDVNPTLFQGVNQAVYVDHAGVTHTFKNVTSVPAGFTVVPALSLVWAVPVSLNLYTALQAAQGLLNYGSSYGTGSCTAGQYSIDPTTAKDGACMPSLNKAQLTSIINGNITDWSSFYFNGVSLSAAAADYDTTKSLTGVNAITPNSGTTVTFCQRTPGSGTAAGQYVYFLNQPTNSATAVPPATNAIDNVFSIADSGNMEKCLDDFSKGTTNAVDYLSVAVNTSGNTGWAIGQQSSDKNNTNAKAYRFIKINGYAPTLANAYNGSYDFTSEATWQYPTAAASGRTQEQLIVKQLIKNAQNPANAYANFNQYVVQQFGAGGFLGTVSNAVTLNSSYTVPTAFNVTYPVNPWTHSNNGSLDNGAFQALDVSPATVVAP
jgi:hypothetical protein